MLTVSLELAKKMKELGWDKVCEYNVIETRLGRNIYHKSQEFDLNDYEKVAFDGYAPTAQELLDELPNKHNDGLLTIQRIEQEGSFGIRYVSAVGFFTTYHGEYEITSKAFSDLNLAEALGQLRCWCKENGYLDANK